MAIGGGDGSIILTTKVDTKGLNSGLNSMKGAITKIGGLLAAAFSVKMLINFANESKNLYKIQMQNEVKLATVMRQRMKATDDEIKSMLELASAQQQIGIIGDEVQLAGLQQIATFATQKETIETLLPAMNNLIAQQYGYEASTESARNVANLMGKVLQGQVGALTRVGITFSAAEEQMLKTGNEMERAAVLAQVITNNVGQMNAALAQTDVGRQQQLANTFGDIKEQFGAAFTQLAVLLLPALRALANLLAFIANIARAVAQGIANLFGTKTTDNSSSLANNMQTISGGASSAADNMEDLADATKKARKEAKKSLATFDELNILSSGASGGSDAGETPQTATISAGGDISEIQNGGDGLSEMTKSIKDNLDYLTSTIALSLVAIGLILLSAGNIPWGVGFIIGGASLYNVSKKSKGKFDFGEAKRAIKTLADYIEEILVAIGIVLLFLGNIPWGIGFIIAGAIIYGAKEESYSEYNTADVTTKLAIIMEAVAVSLVGIGIILIFFGHFALGIGFIIVGKELLKVQEQQLKEGEVTTKLQNFFAENSALIVGVGIALVIIGIILLIGGKFTPITFGLLVAGVVVLATAEEINPGIIKETIQGFVKENKNLIIGVSSALLVLGLILLCTGVAIPLGVALIVAGAGALHIADAILNWDFWADALSDVWEGVKKYWDEHIAPVFTWQFWYDLGVKAFQGLIDAAEWALNNIGDVLGGVLGGVFGPGVGLFKIVDAFKNSSLKIPGLAKGAVLPPNKPFMAMLGDQTHGTNIEAPLQTIVDAMNIALAQNGSGGDITIKFEGNLAQLGRVLNPVIERQKKLAGTSFSGTY